MTEKLMRKISGLFTIILFAALTLGEILFFGPPIYVLIPLLFLNAFLAVIGCSFFISVLENFIE